VPPAQRPLGAGTSSSLAAPALSCVRWPQLPPQRRPRPPPLGPELCANPSLPHARAQRQAPATRKNSKITSANNAKRKQGVVLESMIPVKSHCDYIILEERDNLMPHIHMKTFHKNGFFQNSFAIPTIQTRPQSTKCYIQLKTYNCIYSLRFSIRSRFGQGWVKY
jgi:hypothetical protein